MSKTSLSGILHIEAIGGPHDECLEEIRQVLARRGFARLGVALLDSRMFDLAVDEVLLATSDPIRRERVIRVVKKALLDDIGVDMQTAAVGFEADGRGHYRDPRAGMRREDQPPRRPARRDAGGPRRLGEPTSKG